jgi:putative membrane-bound dehydrogenase-like protein
MRTQLALLLLFAVPLFAEPVSLFDGKTLAGWEGDAKLWRVQDGLITGGSLTEKVEHNDFLATVKSFHNFDLKIKLKLTGTEGFINSGVQMRSLRVPGNSEMSGYQVDFGKGWYGKLYDESRRNKVVAESKDMAAATAAIKEGDWNEYRIRTEGAHIQSWINGVPALDYNEADPNIPQDGHIGIQVHGGGKAQVQVKDVTIEELPPTKDAPTWEKLGGVEGVRKLVAPTPAPKPKADADKATIKKNGRDISYNNVQGTPRTAAEEQKLFHLPEGFEIELVVQESEGLGKFVSVYFDQRGRMWTQTALEYPLDGNENPAAAEAVYQSKGKDKVLVYPREALNAALPSGGLTDPTVFADGLAIPLGLLPWGNGDSAYVLHGHDILLLTDTNGDGKSDESKVILTGLGVQDSHLFPHQFTRAPGGWIWMAQGLFNNSKVHQPGSGAEVDWPKCSMARMRPDGSQFEVTSVGPNNIWGLVITGEGEAFIQEANDYGYPVMPFHEYAYYPGGMEALRKSYQPEFPPTAEFRMGGTGLSGLALGEGKFRKLTPTAKENDLGMFVANPIISKVQTIAMHRDGPYWKLEQAADLITCDDPFFRPVGMTQGPDGCLYITDWYNKIISHNEVPRNHPDRDKTRGRIWRVKPVARHSDVGTNSGEGSKPVEDTSRHRNVELQIPDFTKLSTDELIAMLGTQPTARAHLAWQTLGDRRGEPESKLEPLVKNKQFSAARRMQALWALEGIHGDNIWIMDFPELAKDPNRHLRRQLPALDEGALYTAIEESEELAPMKDDTDPDVRAQLICNIGSRIYPGSTENAESSLGVGVEYLLHFAKPSLPGPVTQSSRSPKQIPAREAYDREHERFLVRMFLERRPDVVAKFLDSEAASHLPIEARVLASLALEPKASASRVAKLVPQLDRAPNDEELLRLAQFPAEPGVSDALGALLTNEKSRSAVAEKLLAQRTKLDAAKIAPLLSTSAKAMLSNADASVRNLALQLIGGFQLASLEPELIAALRAPRNGAGPAPIEGASRSLSLRALRDLHSTAAELFATLASSDPDASVRDAALEALAASRAPDAASRLLALYPGLTPAQRRASLTAVSSTKSGARTIVAALLDKSLPEADLDGATAERLATVLGDDPDLAKLQQQLGSVFRDVLLLDGKETAWVDSKITLDGPFTVECWVRLAEGIGNQDGILGSPGQVDMNFFQSKFRVWVGDKSLHDVVVAKKPITPDLWTHVAVTRDAAGNFKIYQNGELDTAGTKQTTAKFENCRIGWTGAKEGTNGALCEFRVWSRERTATEIRANFDRILEGSAGGSPVFIFPGHGQDARAPLGKESRIAKTIDTPPLLTEDQARILDTKFAHYSALARKPGNLENGKVLSAICMACHQIGNTGGQIGPNLSSAGAMGLEGVLRNILTPNAAMESGYRIFRVEMKNGDLVDALYVSDDKDAFVVRQPGLPDRRIAKADVRGTRFIRRSLMPEGLLDALNDEQARDLLGYLMTLK